MIEQFLVRVRMYTIFGLNYLIYFESFFSFFLLETDPRPLYFKTFRLCYGDMWFAGGIYIGCWVIIPPSPLFNPFPVFIPARKFKKQGLIYLDFRSIFLKLKPKKNRKCDTIHSRNQFGMRASERASVYTN